MDYSLPLGEATVEQAADYLYEVTSLGQSVGFFYDAGIYGKLRSGKNENATFHVLSLDSIRSSCFA
jgi:hypothetical protein